MGVPVLLLLLSLAGVAVALVLPGYGDLILLAGPCAIAALPLVLRALVARPGSARNRILTDGSNVMHWRDDTPQIETLREVIACLAAPPR